MQIIYYIFMAIGSIMSILVFLARFTDLMQMIHIVMAGIFLGLVFLISIVSHFLANKQRSSGGKQNKSSIGTSSGGYFSSDQRKGSGTYSEVLEDVNELLKLEKAFHVVSVDAATTGFEKRQYVHKKSREMIDYWGLNAEIKHSRTPVRIIYNATEQDIEVYEPDPPAYRRDDPFADFEPQKLTRVMSNNYEEEDEKDESEKDMNFEFRASASDGDEE